MTTEEKIELANQLERLLQQPKPDIPAIIALAQKIGLLDTDGNIIAGHRN